MKKHKGLWALIITAALAATTLAGCGGGGSASTATKAAGAGTTTSGQTASGEKTTEAAAPAEIPTIVMYNNTGLLVNDADNQLGSDKEAYEAIQNYIIDAIGVKVEVITPPADGTESSQKLSALLAGNDQLDTWWDVWDDYYQDGIIIPINQYLNTPETTGLMDAWDESGWKSMTDNEGNIWGVPRIGQMSGAPIFVRSDWLDLVGMEVPTTFDELNEYLYKIKDLDPYGNGETIPLLIQGGSDPVSNCVENLLAGYTKYGKGRFLDETDGKVKPEYLADGYIDFIKQIHQWYEDGIIHKEFMTHDKTKIQELIMSGRAGATAVWYSRLTGQEDTTRKNVNLDTSKYDYTYSWSDTGVIGPNGQFMQSVHLGEKKAQLISSKCKNPEAVMKYISWAYEPDNQRILHYGLEGVQWEWDPTVENAKEIGAVKKIEGAPRYCREFDVALGAKAESREITFYEDGVRNMHNLWLCDDGVNLDICIYNPLEAEVVFDDDTLSDVAPMGDVNTYRKEEIAKFIKGDRSFDTWDAFIQDMYDLGLEAYVEECTRQYNELK